MKYLASEDIASELKPGQIRCERFGNGTKLLCARSPHITMGNLYYVENNLKGEIWDYFDLGENIVCVNAIGENIQHRLNGCDYDSDTVLITDDKLLVNAAAQYKDFFKVPVCNIKAEEKTEMTLSELDHDTSVNKIGEIVNLSQKLNSILWDELYKGAEEGEILSVYEDICKLAVLSGLEIDKAKRSFENISVNKELTMLRKKYQRPSPNFFAEIDESRSKQHAFYHTAIDDLYALLNKVHFRKGREQYGDYCPISPSLAYNMASGNATEYRHKDKIVEIIDESKAAINRLYLLIRRADEQEREVLYTYLYVKGDFEPIISEEQWDRCKQIRQQRTRYSKFRTENGEVLHKTGIHESGDVWTKKLKCRCGYKMRKNKWRKNKNGEVNYGYKCYNQLN